MLCSLRNVILWLVSSPSSGKRDLVGKQSTASEIIRYGKEAAFANSATIAKVDGD